VEVGVAVIAGLVPAPALTGALHTLISVPSDAVTASCLAHGLLVNNVRPTAIRLVPPLIASRADVDEAVAILGTVLAEAPAKAAAKTAGR